MPLTKFQETIARLLAGNRSEDSHLAGGAALHFQPNSKRLSDDLDFFHDSIERVGAAFEKDRKLLETNKFIVQIEMNQPGFIRTIVSKGKHSTKIEWAHDSAWRFMPVVLNPVIGYQLHPIDLAINKVLALAGRDEPRDFLDIMFIDEKILPFGALCWAAVGKDPGFTPLSLLELLRRRGKYRDEDFTRLHLTEPVDLTCLKRSWLKALDQAEQFIRARPAKEIGCLYYSATARKFVAPNILSGPDREPSTPHYGRPGGVLPKLYCGDRLSDEVFASI